jgi:hypothetical protein
VGATSGFSKNLLEISPLPYRLRKAVCCSKAIFSSLVASGYQLITDARGFWYVSKNYKPI